MAERVCADCGAINHSSADTCWRCLESLPESTPIVAIAEQSTEPKPESQAATG